MPDMWHEEKLLPKKSMLLLNVWALLHDEKRYSNPGSFDPDRFENWTSLSAEYANSADPEKRDHYAYGALTQR